MRVHHNVLHLATSCYAGQVKSRHNIAQDSARHVTMQNNKVQAAKEDGPTLHIAKG